MGYGPQLNACNIDVQKIQVVAESPIVKEAQQDEYGDGRWVGFRGGFEVSEKRNQERKMLMLLSFSPVGNDKTSGMNLICPE
ncbi:uncharacterized protein G2W53_031522 [Senna tora]|uniref:Uncharacterized protein n=1 Tax=Senna tora TaxID=362788 RepID=A0A834T8A7_9FABA|nr:uncharacterized protein G2W53_031522 [Senna tora]